MPEKATTENGNLSKKLTELEESVSKIRGSYGELNQYMEMLRDISARYFRLMDLYAKHGKISVDLAVPEIKDSISKDIVRILLDKSDKDNNGLNLSEITRELKTSRGSSSRRIVRDKVNKLEKMGLVTRIGEGKRISYTISEVLVERWYSLLGLSKH